MARMLTQVPLPLLPRDAAEIAPGVRTDVLTSLVQRPWTAQGKTRGLIKPQKVRGRNCG